MDNNNQEKTEEPTLHKIKKFQEEHGNNYFAELNSFIILTLSVIVFYFFGSNILFQLIQIISCSLIFNHQSIQNISYFLYNIFFQLKKIIYVFFLYIFY